METERKEERYSPVDCIRVIDQDTSEPVGQIADISSGGMKVAGMEALQKDRLRLVIELPADFG